MRIQQWNYKWEWLNNLLNSWPFLLDIETIKSVAVAWDQDGLYFPGTNSLFYNGFLMLRLNFPFGFFLHIKPVKHSRFQCGFGWKLIGRFGLLFRWQTDESAAKGQRGPNLGQAIGWERGTA